MENKREKMANREVSATECGHPCHRPSGGIFSLLDLSITINQGESYGSAGRKGERKHNNARSIAGVESNSGRSMSLT